MLQLDLHSQRLAALQGSFIFELGRILGAPSVAAKKVQ